MRVRGGRLKKKSGEAFSMRPALQAVSDPLTLVVVENITLRVHRSSVHENFIVQVGAGGEA